MLSERINNYYTEVMLDPSKVRKILRISMAFDTFGTHKTEDCLSSPNLGVLLPKLKINRKFRVATEIGSTFFGCLLVTGQLKK
jgi:hypothetical protein